MELGISRNQLYKWQHDVEQHDPEQVFPGTGSRNNISNDPNETLRLKKELARVTEEYDILKKAITFITKEQKRNINLYIIKK